ncbi:MAG TPA: ABC transporter ATP-binding protein [Candidatus Sulfotelmatobacter sp.]|nr:ABC transporter ATP-binding protein [Candidatus Sulfotelmatobacter sp.]
MPDHGTEVELIRVEGLNRVYAQGPIRVAALRDVSFSVPRRAFVAICGPSGSGKSTLLNILGCLDRPTGGRYLLEDVDVGAMNDDALASLRNIRIGFVFQSFHLLPRLTAQRNVEMPMIYCGLSRAERARRAAGALGAVGLLHRAAHRPSELSGGEQQRVAIARALVNDPALLLADEPTGNLDTRAGEEVMDLFAELNGRGVTVSVVTHNPRVAARARRILALEDGRLVADGPAA